MDQRIYSEKLLGIKEQCRSCKDNSKMFSTGYLTKQEGVRYWYIEFQCDAQQHMCDMWTVDYKSLIEEVLRDNEII